MHPRRLDERNTAARQRIATAASILAERFSIDPLAPVAPVDSRDPNVRAMRELENIAAVLDALVLASAEQPEPIAPLNVQAVDEQPKRGRKSKAD